MALQNITIPVPGEPIDLSFMTTLADYIAKINNELLASKTALSSLYTLTGHTVIDTDDVAIWTGIAGPYTVAAKEAVTTKSWSVNYSAEIGFASTPIVTATAIVNPGTTVGISCWVTKATTTSVSGYYRFVSSSQVQEKVSIHVVAIGPGRVQ